MPWTEEEDGRLRRAVEEVKALDTKGKGEDEAGEAKQTRDISCE